MGFEAMAEGSGRSRLARVSLRDRRRLFLQLSRRGDDNFKMEGGRWREEDGGRRGRPEQCDQIGNGKWYSPIDRPSIPPGRASWATLVWSVFEEQAEAEDG